MNAFLFGSLSNPVGDQPAALPNYPRITVGGFPYHSGKAGETYQGGKALVKMVSRKYRGQVKQEAQMRTIREFMDDGIKNKRIANDAAMASKCGVSQATISRWRSGDRVPEDEEVMVLAEVLGEDPYLMLAVARYAKAKNDETREAWEGIADKITQRVSRVIATSITLCALVIPFGHSKEARASQPSESYCFQKLEIPTSSGSSGC